jgi:hypothetical protein
MDRSFEVAEIGRIVAAADVRDLWTVMGNSPALSSYLALLI